MNEIVNKLNQGFLASTGLLSNEEVLKASEIIAEAGLENIETIRVMFVDQHGILRGKTIVAELLPSIFSSGIRVPSTLLLKDVAHRTVFPIWSEQEDVPFKGASDLLLVPKIDSFLKLPWSPHSALIHCDIVHVNGDAIPYSSYGVLSKSVKMLETQGYDAVFGPEIEFHVFDIVDPALEHADTTIPARPPLTRSLNHGYQYLTESRYGEAEKLLDLLRRNAQQMGMPVQSVEIEMGPSQFEFTFAPSDPMTIAQRIVNFRAMVKQVCQQQGLHASFMAKPKIPNIVANGMHIHQSLIDKKTGENVFTPNANEKMTTIANQWIAGLLDNAQASCLFTTPTVNGYKRYAPYQLAPNKIGWGHDNKGAMVRTLFVENDQASRIENRVPDSTANPYFALSSQILSGLDGINRKLTAPDQLHNPYENDAERLPTSLRTAIECFEASPLYRRDLGDDFVGYFSKLKRAEWEKYLMTVSEWEQAEYFTAF